MSIKQWVKALAHWRSIEYFLNTHWHGHHHKILTTGSGGAAGDARVLLRVQSF